MFTLGSEVKFMIDYVSIGKRIKKNRLNQGMTQEILAEKVNISIPHISRIENGSSSPSLQTLVDICNALDITIDNLMQDSLPAAKKRIGGRLNVLLADCTIAEMNMVVNVVDVLLQEIREIQKN